MTTRAEKRHAHPVVSALRMVVSSIIGSTGLLLVAVAVFGDFRFAEALLPLGWGAAHLIGSWLVWPNASDLGLGD